jgi:hypothetical protein
VDGGGGAGDVYELDGMFLCPPGGAGVCSVLTGLPGIAIVSPE